MWKRNARIIYTFFGVLLISFLAYSATSIIINTILSTVGKFPHIVLKSVKMPDDLRLVGNKEGGGSFCLDSCFWLHQEYIFTGDESNIKREVTKSLIAQGFIEQKYSHEYFFTQFENDRRDISVKISFSPDVNSLRIADKKDINVLSSVMFVDLSCRRNKCR